MTTRLICLGFTLLTAILFSSCLTLHTPESCLNRILRQADHENNPAIWECFTAQTKDYVTEYRELQTELQATTIPRDPMAVFLLQMRSEQPQITSVTYREDEAVADVRYAGGMSAQFVFRREAADWKLDLAEELESALNLLRQARERLHAYHQAYETGQPIPREKDDD